MAHELAKNAKTGKLSYVGVGESPWHVEGITKPADYVLGFDETGELAGWDYEMEVMKLRDILPGGYSTYKDFQCVVRKDTKLVLAVMGEDYTYLNNRDAFEICVPLLDKGFATIETSGTLRQGADAWLLLRFKVDNPIVQEVFADKIIPFGLIANNHTGQARCILKETPIRVVCANTLGMSLSQRTRELRVKHRGDVKQRVVDAAMEMYEGLIERYVLCAEQYKMLKARRMTENEFVDHVLDLIAPLPDPESKAFDRALEKRATIEAKWTRGKGHVGDNSAWEAYNGVCEVVDHNQEIYRMNKNKETGKESSRVEALIDGRLAKVVELAAVGLPFVLVELAVAISVLSS